MNEIPRNDRSVAEIFADLKSEVQQFFQIRIQLLRQETSERLNSLKWAGLLVVAAVLLLVTAYLLITIGLAALIASFFLASPFHWFFGFAAVGVLWAILGGIAAFLGMKEMKTIKLRRTIEVLKGDTQWLKQEIKTQV